MIINTDTDLQSLPVGTVVMDSTGQRWRKDDDDPQPDDGPALPAFTFPGWGQEARA